MKTFDTALLVGTTGMLGDVTRWVSQRSARTYVVSRSGDSAAGCPVRADWTDSSFRSRILDALDPRQVDLAVLWIHSDGAANREWLTEQLSPTACVVHVVSHDAPPAPRDVVEVRLGSVQGEQGRRWLTWAEICAGTIQAIETEESRLVGELRTT